MPGLDAFFSFEPFRTSNRPERRSPSSERPQVTFRTVLAGALLAFPCFGKHTRRPSEHEALPSVVWGVEASRPVQPPVVFVS